MSFLMSEVGKGAVTGILDSVGGIIDRFMPNKTEAQKAEIAKEMVRLQGDIQLQLGQLEINKVEAAHPSVFVAGARPAVLWICALGLGYELLARPLLGWAMSNLFAWTMPVDIDMLSLIGLLGGLLGLSGLRTFEKVQGVDTRGLATGSKT